MIARLIMSATRRQAGRCVHHGGSEEYSVYGDVSTNIFPVVGETMGGIHDDDQILRSKKLMDSSLISVVKLMVG